MTQNDEKYVLVNSLCLQILYFLVKLVFPDSGTVTASGRELKWTSASATVNLTCCAVRK